MKPRISEANRAPSYDARQNWGASHTAFGGPNPKGVIDKFAIIPILACVFSTIVSPLEYTIFNLDPYGDPPRHENILASDGCDFHRFGGATSFSSS